MDLEIIFEHIIKTYGKNILLSRIREAAINSGVPELGIAIDLYFETKCARKKTQTERATVNENNKQ